MGRFEKRAENPRIRGELSRAAENALWDVVEDLENLQQNLLRTLQEDVKRLEAEKNRLSHDIQKLITEKEQLQQSRQITEQQVLIRQLSEVLAKHISSQLQSSLQILATQTLEHHSSNHLEIKNTQLNNHPIHDIGQNVSTIIESLDHSVTNAFSSLSQELKNYQSDLSQQLAQMYSQQQQGEIILAEVVNRLQYQLEKNRDTNLDITTAGAPTVLQLPDGLRDQSIHQNGNGEKSAPKIITEAMTLIPHQLPQVDSTSAATIAILSSPDSDENPQSDSLIKPDLTTTSLSENPQSDSLIKPDLTTTSPIVKTSELTTVLTSQVLTAPALGGTQPELSSVLTNNLSTRRPPAPKLRRETTPKPQTSPRQQRQRTSPNWSELQIGFLLISLYTVVSSLYNVAIKAIFLTSSNSDPLAGLATQQLILPTLGNIFLILMLRLLVVVPLMVLLSPILHPLIWEDLENLFASLGGKAIPSHNKTKQAVFLSVISGFLLFLSQVLVYLAIGEVTTSMAIALFFIYPIISVFLSWFLFQERPNLLITGAMAVIFAGELLILGGQSVVVNNTSLGSTTAILSGIVFAIYVIVTRICANKLKLHPVSLTLINFTTMLLLSFACLIIPLPSNLGLVINSSNILELVLSAFILGVLTLCAYLFNNFGIRKLGTPLSSLIGATVPILTVIFGSFMLQESLEIVQIMGVILVTVGAACIGWRKTPSQPQLSK
ncbi:MAG: EamA family transporter [Dolichospermum sp.]